MVSFIEIKSKDGNIFRGQLIDPEKGAAFHDEFLKVQTHHPDKDGSTVLTYEARNEIKRFSIVNRVEKKEENIADTEAKEATDSETVRESE